MDTETTLMDPIRLEGRAAEVAVLIGENRKTHDKAHEALNEEFDKRNEEVCAAAKETHDALWSELNQLTNTSPERSLVVDVEYVDLGFCFLKEEPKQESPFSGLRELLEG